MEINVAFLKVSGFGTLRVNTVWNQQQQELCAVSSHDHMYELWFSVKDFMDQIVAVLAQVETFSTA